VARTLESLLDRMEIIELLHRYATAIGGTYLDEMVRTAHGWRIRERDLRITWQEGNPRVLGG